MSLLLKPSMLPTFFQIGASSVMILICLHWPVLRTHVYTLYTFFEDRGITPSRITPGKPWQNGSNESLNGTFRRECLDAEVFRSLAEARVVIEDWRRLYNHQRPHSTLGYQTPASSYWGQGGHNLLARISQGQPPKTTHTIGHKTTIVDRSDSEVGEKSFRIERAQDLITRKT